MLGQVLELITLTSTMDQFQGPETDHLERITIGPGWVIISTSWIRSNILLYKIMDSFFYERIKAKLSRFENSKLDNCFSEAFADLL